MPIEFPCPSCQRTLRVGDDAAGKQAKCPQCGNIVPIPAATAPAGNLPEDQPAAPGESSPFATSAATGKDAANPYASPTTESYQPAKFQVAPGAIGNQQVDPGTIINYAWEVWKTNLGLLIGVFVFIVAVNYAIALVMGVTQGVLNQNDAPEAAAIVALIGNLISNVIGIYLSIGQAQIALKLARHQPAQFSDVFQGGPRFLPVLGGSILAGLALMAGFLLCIVPGVILMLLFWPFYYLLVDNKTGVFESFSTAYTITQNNVGSTFVLWLASFGIMLAGLLALCIGVLFAAPLVTMIWATAYLMMSGQLAAQPAYAKGY